MSAAIELDRDTLLVMPAERWRTILAEVADEFGVSVETICGRAQRVAVLKARYKAIHRIRQELGYSTTKIGKIFGRDHTTIVAALKGYERIMSVKYIEYPSKSASQANWSEREDAILRKGFASGYTDYDIVLMLANEGINRSEGAVNKRRRRLDLVSPVRIKRTPKPRMIVRVTAPKVEPPSDPHAAYKWYVIHMMREIGAKTIGDLKAYVRGQELDVPREKPFRCQLPIDETRSLVGTHFAHIPRGQP